MPWYVWYIVVGFVWMLWRAVFAGVVFACFAFVRDSNSLTPGSFISMFLFWPVDALWFSIFVTTGVAKFWSARRTAKRMLRERA